MTRNPHDGRRPGDRRRHVRAPRIGPIATMGLLAAALLVGALSGGCVERREKDFQDRGPGESHRAALSVLNVYCAAGIRPPMERIKDAFEEQHPGVEVRMEYDGSGKLLGRLVTAKALEYRPDVFVAGDPFYGDMAREHELVDRVETLATFRPVIAVPRSNPKSIGSLADLAREGLAVALGDSRATAIGKATDALLEKADLKAVRRNSRVGGSTVQELGNAVMLGHADAAIVWDVTTRQGDFAGAFTVIPIPQAENVPIVICRIKDARNRELANAFMKLATQSDLARQAFTADGYTVSRPETKAKP
jgi:molybdate transport system substrate-binding protein